MGGVKVVIIEKCDDGVLIQMTTIEKATGLYGSACRTKSEIGRFIEETLDVKLKD